MRETDPLFRPRVSYEEFLSCSALGLYPYRLYVGPQRHCIMDLLLSALREYNRLASPSLARTLLLRTNIGFDVHVASVSQSFVHDWLIIVLLSKHGVVVAAGITLLIQRSEAPRCGERCESIRLYTCTSKPAAHTAQTCHNTVLPADWRAAVIHFPVALLPRSPS